MFTHNHSSPVSGTHPGLNRTWEKASQNFSLGSLYPVFLSLLERCPICVFLFTQHLTPYRCWQLSHLHLVNSTYITTPKCISGGFFLVWTTSTSGLLKIFLKPRSPLTSRISWRLITEMVEFHKGMVLALSFLSYSKAPDLQDLEWQWWWIHFIFTQRISWRTWGQS